MFKGYLGTDSFKKSTKSSDFKYSTQDFDSSKNSFTTTGSKLNNKKSRIQKNISLEAKRDKDQKPKGRKTKSAATSQVKKNEFLPKDIQSDLNGKNEKARKILRNRCYWKEKTIHIKYTMS